MQQHPLAILLAGLLLAGCGGGSSTAAAGKNATPSATIPTESAADQAARIKAYDEKVAKDTADKAASAKALADKDAEFLAARDKILAEAEAAKANTLAGDGTFLVGSDVKPGTYKSPGPTGTSCYWARYSDEAQTDIIDNNNSKGPSILVIKPTDKSVQTSGCENFVKAK